MSLLPSLENIRAQLDKEKANPGTPNWDRVKFGECPLCGDKLRQDARWLWCRRPSKHPIFRAGRERFNQRLQAPIKADPPKKKRNRSKKRNSFRSQYRKNFSKAARDARASDLRHFRSI